jgi:hypothetical protein
MHQGVGVFHTRSAKNRPALSSDKPDVPTVPMAHVSRYRQGISRSKELSLLSPLVPARWHNPVFVVVRSVAERTEPEHGLALISQ